MRNGHLYRSAITGEVVGGLVYIVCFSAGLVTLLPLLVVMIGNIQVQSERVMLAWAMLATSFTYNVILGILAFKFGRKTWPLMLLNLTLFLLVYFGLMILGLQSTAGQSD